MGQVVQITDTEIQFELYKNGPSSNDGTSEPPLSEKTNFQVEFVWKSTSYDCCLKVLNIYCIDDKFITLYLYHKLLGYKVAPEGFPKIGNFMEIFQFFWVKFNFRVLAKLAKSDPGILRNN